MAVNCRSSSRTVTQVFWMSRLFMPGTGSVFVNDSKLHRKLYRQLLAQDKARLFPSDGMVLVNLSKITDFGGI